MATVSFHRVDLPASRRPITSRACRKQGRSQMSAARVNNLDLTAPPVVKTVAQRSLIVGVVFGVISLILAFTRSDEFYRGYLLGFMAWLGVSLGSMAILMIRHLTG